jgi:hypothetical protein
LLYNKKAIFYPFNIFKEFMMWRQGDVLFAKIETIPDSIQRRADLVLAEGEVTGHRHRIQDEATAELWAGQDGLLYLKVIADEATVIHDEHAAIRLERGLYRVWQQREYTPEKPRPVYD